MMKINIFCSNKKKDGERERLIWKGEKRGDQTSSSSLLSQKKERKVDQAGAERSLYFETSVSQHLAYSVVTHDI